MPDSKSKASKSPSKKKRKTTSPKDDKKVLRPKKQKIGPDDGIAKSKQLVQKLQTSRSNSSCRSKLRSTNNNEVRLCGNGKPMPSLAELEKMFEDSDSEGEPEEKSKGNSTPKATSTPKMPVEKLISPKTIESIANRMLNLVSNLTEPPLPLDDDGPPPPVIKPKKKKKSDIPYIVGCKERAYVPPKPNNTFCKGDDKYGVDSIDEDDDDDIPKKRAKRSKIVNLTKSKFNALSDDIAARLKENDDSNASSDSNKTVAYEYYTPQTNNTRRSFSPLPSTSKDDVTFVKNDQLFNESLNCENPVSISMSSDVEIIETPCETIVIDDTLPIRNKPVIKNEPLIIELLEDSSTETPNKKGSIDIVTKPSDDDSVQLVDIKPASPIPVDDYYSSYCKLNTMTYNDDECEVIDVDDLIAENAAIINKYSKKDDLGKVTLVDMTTSTGSAVDNSISTVNIEDESRTTNVNERTINVQATSNIPPPSSNEDLICVETSAPSQDDSVLKNIESNLQKLQSILNVMPNDGNIMLEEALSNLNKIRNNSKVSKPGSQNTTGSSALQGALHTPNCFVREDTDQRGPQVIDRPSTDSQEAGPKNLGDCPICMDTLSNKSVASTMCGHIFCMNCIKKSIKASGKKCPTCRKSLRGAGFHQIFL